MEIKPVCHLNATVEVPGSKELHAEWPLVVGLPGGGYNPSSAMRSFRRIRDILWEHCVSLALKFSSQGVMLQSPEQAGISISRRVDSTGDNGTALRFLTTLASLGRVNIFSMAAAAS